MDPLDPLDRRTPTLRVVRRFAALVAIAVPMLMASTLLRGEPLTWWRGSLFFTPVWAIVLLRETRDATPEGPWSPTKDDATLADLRDVFR